ncbi:MAG: toll/interleukin-1 receptor domain-containing protein [Verrucomicrobiales bacterium]|nr:toll/interleukin-1 receptor domain-containing protein [Verrucomicrobiales bacterium]
MATQLRQKRAAGEFDVFLCHNSADKPAVRQLGQQLKARGLLPWLDEWELPPGQPWQRHLESVLEKVRSAAVCFGGSGEGPWQQQEIDALLRLFVKRQSPVIPVLLPGAPAQPDLPLFLQAMTWVDLRIPDPDPLTRLIWGITGKHPEA